MTCFLLCSINIMYSFICHTMWTPTLLCHLCCAGWVLIVAGVAMHGASADSQGCCLLGAPLITLLFCCSGISSVLMLCKQKDSLEESAVSDSLCALLQTVRSVWFCWVSHSFVLPYSDDTSSSQWKHAGRAWQHNQTTKECCWWLTALTGAFETGVSFVTLRRKEHWRWKNK